MALVELSFYPAGEDTYFHAHVWVGSSHFDVTTSRTNAVAVRGRPVILIHRKVPRIPPAYAYRLIIFCERVRATVLYAVRDDYYSATPLETDLVLRLVEIFREALADVGSHEILLDGIPRNVKFDVSDIVASLGNVRVDPSIEKLADALIEVSSQGVEPSVEVYIPPKMERRVKIRAKGRMLELVLADTTEKKLLGGDTRTLAGNVSGVSFEILEEVLTYIVSCRARAKCRRRDLPKALRAAFNILEQYYPAETRVVLEID